MNLKQASIITIITTAMIITRIVFITQADTNNQYINDTKNVLSSQTQQKINVVNTKLANNKPITKLNVVVDNYNNTQPQQSHDIKQNNIVIYLDTKAKSITVKQNNKAKKDFQPNLEVKTALSKQNFNNAINQATNQITTNMQLDHSIARVDKSVSKFNHALSTARKYILKFLLAICIGIGLYTIVSHFKYYKNKSNKALKK